jgi:hypothetical protein
MGLEELLQRLEDREALLGEFEYRVLKGVLRAGADREPLVYLQDEPSNTLLDSFVCFFVHRICLFKNAWHVLDVEPVIQDRLRACRFVDDGSELSSFRFVDSKAEPGVQASDALVGLLGKLFSYLTRTDTKQLITDRRELNPGQARTLGKINALLDRSNSETPALLHQVASARSTRAGQFFLDASPDFAKG